MRLSHLCRFLICFLCDWRLELLSIATIPIHVLFYGHSMKDARRAIGWTQSSEEFLQLWWSSFREFCSQSLRRSKEEAHLYLDAWMDLLVYHNWCIPQYQIILFSFVLDIDPVLIGQLRRRSLADQCRLCRYGSSSDFDMVPWNS